MEESVLQRINAALKAKKSNPTRLSTEIGMQQSTLSRQLKGVNNMTLETFSSILAFLGDVSAEWLLTGKGKMQKEDKTDQEEEIKQLRAENLNLEKKISKLEGKNELLQEQLEMKK